MAERITGAQRLRLQNIAQKEIDRYANDHALWHKHVHNTDLDPVQILKCIEMDEHMNTVDFSCRRTGKTVVKELYLLKFLSCNDDQELGIVAPREAQSLVNLGYHLDAIRRSEILDAFLMHKAGRKQLADTYFEFSNRSKVKAYGIMAQIDGGDLTAASIEEIDDMPKDRLFSRFLLMMGATRRLGADDDARNDPQIRITGVFKGADTLTDLIESANYYQLPLIDVYLGMEMGILNEQFMVEMRDQLSPDEYLRQLMCVNVSAHNLIYEKFVRRAMQVGLMAQMEPDQPMPGERYKKRGLLGFGFDAGGHGESVHASRDAFVVAEQIGNYICFPFVKTWPPGVDDQVVLRDLAGFWEYFMPDTALGDAYGVGMLTQLNDDLLARGFTDIDRRAIGNGNSTASTWPEWAFSPIRFEGMVKHQMAAALRAIFHNKQAAIPYFDDMAGDPETDDFRSFIKQLPNIVTKETRASYSSYKMANSKLGDDLFDAAMAAVWGLVTRGAGYMPGSILTQSTTREKLLGVA